MSIKENSPKQKPKNNGGDSNIGNFSNSQWQAGRDINVHIGTKIEKNELKNQGFDLGVDAKEIGIIKVGRWLLNKLGLKLFFSIFTVLLGGPLAYMGYGFYIVRENSSFFLNNFILLFIAILILVFSLAILFSGLNSKCKFCKSLFATIPIKKTLIDSTKYKGRELYKINEIRRCDFCGKINSIGYTEEYTEESDEE